MKEFEKGAIVRQVEYEKGVQIAVAKRQRRKKSCENGAKENPWTGVRTSGETNTPPSWLAQFAEGRLKVGETNI